MGLTDCKKLKTPVDRYENDPVFRNLVTLLEAHIHQADFTPSELREAVMLACINYEMYRSKPRFIIPEDVDAAIKVLDKWKSP